MNCRGGGQVLRQLLAALRPIRFPGVSCVDPRFGAELQLIRIAGSRRIRWTFDVLSERSASLGCTPELVPPAQGTIEADRFVGRDGHLAETGADIDVTFRSERLQVAFDPGVLAERLDE